VPQWGPFLAVVGVLTALLLVLARQSQRLVRESAGAGAGDGDTGPGAPPESPGPGDSPDDANSGRDADGVSDADSGAPDADSGAPDADSDSDDHSRPDSRNNSGDNIKLTSGVLLANVAATQGLVVVIIVAAAWYFAIPATAFGVTAEPLAAGLPGVAVGITFGLALWLANELSTTLADAVGATYDEAVRELLAPASARGWAGLFLVVLPLIAVAEELLFRAALIGVPAAGFELSPWLLAVGSSLAFALGHGAQGRVGVVVTGVLGLVLAAGYILTGSLLVVVLAHYVINAMEFFVHEFLGITTVLPLAVQSGERPRM